MSHGLSFFNSSLCSSCYVPKCETILESGRTSWVSTSEENKWSKGMSDIRLQLVVKNDLPLGTRKPLGSVSSPWRNYFNIQSPSIVMAASQPSDTSDKMTHFWTKASCCRLIKMQRGFECFICVKICINKLLVHLYPRLIFPTSIFQFIWFSCFSERESECNSLIQSCVLFCIKP